MARKQSSTIWYQGNPHKEIYFQGHYHDKMYKGSQLVWEKLDNEYAPNKLYRIYDYATWNNETYCIVAMYGFNPSTKEQTFEDVYIAKFNSEKMCLDLTLKGFLTSDNYDSYYLHACKDGIVLIEWDSKFSNTNTENEPVMRIADYPLSKNSVFKNIEQGTFTEDTTIFVPSHIRKDKSTGTHYYGSQYVLFSTDYYIKQTITSENQAVITKYNYANEVIKQSTPTDYSVEGARQSRVRNVFELSEDKYVSYVTTYNSINTSMENIRGLLVDKGISSKVQQVIEATSDAYYQIINTSNMGLTKMCQKRVMARYKDGVIFSAFIYPKNGTGSMYVTIRNYIGKVDGISMVNTDISPHCFVTSKNSIIMVHYNDKIADVYEIKENEIKKFSTGISLGVSYTSREIWIAEDENNYYVISDGYYADSNYYGLIYAFDKETLKFSGTRQNMKYRYI